MDKKDKIILGIIFGIILIRIVLVNTPFPSMFLDYLVGIGEEPYACPEDAKVCNDGTVVVRVGKDCEFEPCPDVEENRVYCKPEDRNSDACFFLWEPVCAYPMKKTESNDCIACSKEEVEYWVSGIC